MSWQKRWEKQNKKRTEKRNTDSSHIWASVAVGLMHVAKCGSFRLVWAKRDDRLGHTHTPSEELSRLEKMNNVEWNSITKNQSSISAPIAKASGWLVSQSYFGFHLSIRLLSVRSGDQGKCRLVWHDRWSVAASLCSGLESVCTGASLCLIFSCVLAFVFMPQRTIYTLKHFNFYCIERLLPFLLCSS